MKEVTSILLIRFSSFGDLVQASTILAPLKKKYPKATIHWATKKEFISLVKLFPEVDHIHCYNSATGLQGLRQFYQELKTHSFDLVYDAHHNLRSFFLRAFFLLSPPSHRPSTWIARPKNRWRRFLLFSFRVNTFRPWPFKGAQSFHTPLNLEGSWDQPGRWQLDDLQQKLHGTYPLLQGRFLAVALGAAWPMKTWPLAHWKTLLSHPMDYPVVFLGGKNEREAAEEVRAHLQGPGLNLCGELSLSESSAVVSLASVFISADTGLLHVGDVLGTKTIALIGPTAFGHPSFAQVKVLEESRQHPCRPCTKDGRGTCLRPIYQECMVDLGPEKVLRQLNEWAKTSDHRP